MNEYANDVLKNSIEYLSEWEKRFNQANQIAPFVHLALEVTQWEYDVVLSAPSSQIKEYFSELTPLYVTDYNGLCNNLPMLPNINVRSSTAATPVSAVCETYDILTNHIKANDVSYSWARKKAEVYEKIQENNTVKNVIREKLEKLNPEIKQEFDEAENYFILYKAGSQNQQSSAITMRNVLESYKGELFYLSKRPPEQSIKWNVFAERLCIGEIGEEIFQKLIHQGEVHANIHCELSLISKNMKTVSIDEMISIHTKYINHLYTVLLSVKNL